MALYSACDRETEESSTAHQPERFYNAPTKLARTCLQWSRTYADPIAAVERGPLRARAPGAGDQHGCRSTPLFLHRHLHLDRLQWIVEFVARGGNDLVDDLHAPKDFAKDGVGAVQSAVVIDTDIEL